MKKNSKSCSLVPKVKKHIKKDLGEYRDQISDDKKLLKSMKSKISSRALSK